MASSDDKTKYKVVESAQYNSPASEGTLEIIDKNYLDVNMSKNSNKLNPSDIVDEPELSLHLTWQKLFIEQTLKTNNNIQLIFATHSPKIGGRHRDKMYKLEKVLGE